MIVRTVAYFSVQTKSAENLFHTTEWVPANTSVILKHKNINNEVQEYTNAEKVTSYIDQNGEHFQLTVEPDSNQFLSFFYKLESQETAEKFDAPAVVLFAGSTPILQFVPAKYDDIWHETYIDLSKSSLEPGVYDLFFVAKNTYDDFFAPTFTVKEVTTSKFFPNDTSFFQFETDKQVNSIFVEYKMCNNEEEKITIQEIKPHINVASTFIIPNNFCGDDIIFWSVDAYNNTESLQYSLVQYSHKLNSQLVGLNWYTESDHELYLQLQIQNSSLTPVFFLAKVSQAQIESEADWEQAELLTQVQRQQYILKDIPVSYSVGEVENNLVYQNISEGQVYVSVRQCNESMSCEYILKNQLIEFHL